MFDDYVNLRPLKGVAEILANDNSWGQLYNLDQLAKNEVAISAATYVNFLIPSVITKMLHHPSDIMKTCISSASLNDCSRVTDTD